MPKYKVGQVFKTPDYRKLKIHGYREGNNLLHYVERGCVFESDLLATKGITKNNLRSGSKVLFPNGRYFTLIECFGVDSKKAKDRRWSYRDPVDVVMSDHELDQLQPEGVAYWSGAQRPQSALLRRLNTSHA